MAGLLVSVRSAAEAEIALAGGAAIIDVKEPDNGSLGRARPEVIAQVLAAVAGRRPVSAALGELRDAAPALPPLTHLAYVKWGLAGCQSETAGWEDRLNHWRTHIETSSPCRMVVTAYADSRRAAATSVGDVVYFVARERFAVLLLDTWQKDGTTLLDWLSLAELREWHEMCQSVGVRLALAGSLGASAIRTLLPLHPDWFAVRADACGQRQRRGALEEDRVRELAVLVSQTTSGG